MRVWRGGTHEKVERMADHVELAGVSAFHDQLRVIDDVACGAGARNRGARGRSAKM